MLSETGGPANIRKRGLGGPFLTEGRHGAGEGTVSLGLGRGPLPAGLVGEVSAGARIAPREAGPSTLTQALTYTRAKEEEQLKR